MSGMVKVREAVAPDSVERRQLNAARPRVMGLGQNITKLIDYIYNEDTGEIETASDSDEDWFTVRADDGGNVADTVHVEVDG